MPAIVLICIAVVCPLALFKLLAFVDPGTASGAAMRAGLAAIGGLQGLLRGNAGRRRADGTAAQTSGSQSAGEASADAATTARVDQRGAAGRRLPRPGRRRARPPASGAITTVGAAGTSVFTDLTNQAGVGHNTYYPDYQGGSRRPAARANREANATDDQPRRPRTRAHRQWRHAGTPIRSAARRPTTAQPPVRGSSTPRRRQVRAVQPVPVGRVRRRPRSPWWLCSKEGRRSMATVYGDYTRDRSGLFFGLTGGQLITLVVAGVPALWAFQRQQWAAVAGSVAGLGAGAGAGRGADPGTVGDRLAGRLDRATWPGRRCAGPGGGPSGDRAQRDLAEPDLPGVLAGISIHDGPPQGPTNTRVAIIQDHANRTVGGHRRDHPPRPGAGRRRRARQPGAAA